MCVLTLLNYLCNQLCFLVHFSELYNIVADFTEYYMQHNIVYECNTVLTAGKESTGYTQEGGGRQTPELLYVRIDSLPCPAALRTSQGKVWWTVSAWDRVARGRLQCILNRTMQGDIDRFPHWQLHSSAILPAGTDWMWKILCGTTSWIK